MVLQLIFRNSACLTPATCLARIAWYNSRVGRREAFFDIMGRVAWCVVRVPSGAVGRLEQFIGVQAGSVTWRQPKGINAKARRREGARNNQKQTRPIENWVACGSIIRLARGLKASNPEKPSLCVLASLRLGVEIWTPSPKPASYRIRSKRPVSPVLPSFAKGGWGRVKPSQTN